MTERKILENSIRDHTAAINKAEEQLKQLDQPGLKHGEYGFEGGVGAFICLGKCVYWLRSGSKSSYPPESFIDEDVVVYGNLTDELKEKKQWKM